jgi:hypothetical protein
MIMHPDTYLAISSAVNQERQRYAAQQHLAETPKSEGFSPEMPMLKARRVIATLLYGLARRLAGEGSAIAAPPALERGLVIPKTCDA